MKEWIKNICEQLECSEQRKRKFVLEMCDKYVDPKYNKPISTTEKREVNQLLGSAIEIFLFVTWLHERGYIKRHLYTSHLITGGTIRVQAMEENNVISCKECLFRQKEFRKICPTMRCVDMATGKCQTYKQVKS